MKYKIKKFQSGNPLPFLKDSKKPYDWFSEVPNPLDILHVIDPTGTFPKVEAQMLIEKYEQFRPTPYRPTKHDKLTIGYGLTDKKYIRQGRMSEVDASLAVREYINKHIIPTLSKKPYYDKLSPKQKTALISLSYNIGQTKFDKSVKLQEALTKGDWESAIKEMDHGMNNPETPGLKTRRLEEQKLFANYLPISKNQFGGILNKITYGIRIIRK